MQLPCQRIWAVSDAFSAILAPKRCIQLKTSTKIVRPVIMSGQSLADGLADPLSQREDRMRLQVGYEP